jgi:hypothetical protein
MQHDFRLRDRHGLDHMVIGFMLPMQSVPITTNVVSPNPTQTGCTRYNIIVIVFILTTKEYYLTCIET